MAKSLDSFITLTYAEQEHKVNASYSDWVDTKDNELFILYEPSNETEAELITFYIEVKCEVKCKLNEINES